MVRRIAALRWLAALAIPACFAKPPAPEALDATPPDPRVDGAVVGCFQESFDIPSDGCGTWAQPVGTASITMVTGSLLQMVLLSDPGNASSFCISAPRTFVSGSIEIVTLFGSSTLDRTKISVSTTLGLDYGAVITGDGISQQLHTECAGVQRGTVPWFPDLDRFVRLRASAPNMLVVETSPMGMAPWRIVGDCMIPDGFASMRFVVGADRGRGSSGSEVAELDTLELCPK